MFMKLYAATVQRNGRKPKNFRTKRMVLVGALKYKKPFYN